MEIEIYRRRRDQGLVGLAIVILKRLVAFFLLVFALTYWARITGIYPGGEVRFDTMPEHWRIAAPVLAVMLPVSALGLWGQFSWGTISWLLTVCAELSLFLGMPDLYGANTNVVLFHLISVGTYFGLKAISRLIGGSRHILPSRSL
ncbi:MAG: hypothetical protein KDJ80_13750 [Nitratireductor sp.]|nr:hypothetical protein [Nitratireductor sp.]